MKRQFIILAALWITLAAYLALLQPGKLPILLLVVPFLLLFLALYNTWKVVAALYVWQKTGVKRLGSRNRLGLVVSGGAVLLLVLQSLGQLTFRDVITLGAIVVVGYLYVIRSRTNPT